MLDKDGKYTLKLSPELVGYISQFVRDERTYADNNIMIDPLVSLILPLIEEWEKAETEYCGYNTADFIDVLINGKSN